MPGSKLYCDKEANDNGIVELDADNENSLSNRYKASRDNLWQDENTSYFLQRVLLRIGLLYFAVLQIAK